MTVEESLGLVRAHWVDRVSHELARGEGVRAGFVEQLERFFDLLAQVVRTGDPAWLDPILREWGSASTETNLEQGGDDVALIMTRMVSITIEVLKEDLDRRAAVETLAAVIPILTHSLSVVLRHEMELRVAHVSNQLGQVQRKLQELDRSKSSFISVAAHELKTPLTLIEGYASMMAELIGRASPDAPVGRILEGVDTGIKRLRRIIDDMIDLSLIDNNLLKIDPRPVRVSHLLRLIRNEVAGSIESRRQHLLIKPFDLEGATVLGDLERLYQALENVTSNAIKFTPDHGTITFDGRLLPGFIEIIISDTGIGIPPENQAAIFDKFGQVGRSDLHSSGRVKFKGGGPGLGLPIARGILEAHGGSIWVESEGQDEEKLPGSKFHILLPIYEGAAPQPIEASEAGSRAQEKADVSSAKPTTTSNHPTA
jgi:signal transduction histidine kinase